MMLVFLSSFSLYYLNEEENARVMRVLSLFRCKKTFLPFFHFFLFFGLGFLSFFLASLLEKEAFLLHSCALCVYSLSPLPFLLFARRRERFTF